MIIKPCTKPMYVRRLEALIRRLHPEHHQFAKIKEEYAKRLAGYKGEKEIQYHLQLLPEQDFCILHDVRLFDGTSYFQIDVLVLSTKRVIILEIKNIIGTLHFDSNYNQLIRTFEEKEDAFPDPLIQIDRQTMQLESFFKRNRLLKLPIHAFVTISNPRSIIKSSSHIKRIIHNAKAPFTILSINNQYSQPEITSHQLKSLAKKILKHHTHLEMPSLQTKGINPEDIKTGVQCPKCDALPMIRVTGNWWCPSCSYSSKDEHKKALSDYAILFGQNITNQEARTFLRLRSSSITRKILSSISVKKMGDNKGRIYHLPFENG